ncbi:hypothetical protein IMZ38_01595 [Thermosphaera chiliense]|uniref:Uncharacterized protein n=1 Tax=Thermosphaera chiliense TaxID=3402707 RepID=A0A7M1UQX9_9CREN|nr:hypothetical protein [Thermosphaera aggregans]QOR94655.1 hypothetical protein IMZ38_01595 [Thermosphaera aggregans]
MLDKADLVLCYERLYEAIHKAISKKNTESLMDAAEQCEKLGPATELDLGLVNKVRPPELARELVILTILLSLPPLEEDKIKLMNLDVAKEFEKVANILLSEGPRRFILGDIVGIHDSLDVIGHRLFGYSRIIVAVHIEEKEPNKALGLYLEASPHLQDTPEAMRFINDKISKLSKTTRCWICDREIQGEDINYVYLPATINEYMRERYGKNVPYLINGNNIAVCKVCYTMIHNLSDEISKYYYNLTMEKLTMMEKHIYEKIDELISIIEKIMTRLEHIEEDMKNMEEERTRWEREIEWRISEIEKRIGMDHY